MKAQNEKVFAAHVAQAIAKAQAIGSNATWTTEKHLDALAEAIAATLPHNGQTDADSPAIPAIREVLGECYNISQYQQELDRKFRKAGSKHFNREGKKTVKELADDLISQLARGNA